MSNLDLLFQELNADELPEVTEIEDSFCFNCHQSGTTKLLLTKIPFFRDVIISSFSCDHCGYVNRNIDPAGKVQEKGVRFILSVKNSQDLNRRIVQSKYSVVRIPELDSVFPNSEGKLTTVEGCVRSVMENIGSLQNERRESETELADKLDLFLLRLGELLLSNDFTLILEDPSGNSVIELLNSPNSDPQLFMEYYVRNESENEALGCYSDNVEQKVNEKTYADETQEEFKAKNEVVVFFVNCPTCNAVTESRMKILDIPHFKEVIVMATTCDSCGLRENEIKGGLGISDKGQRITLKIECAEDLTRDFLKSVTAAVNIPELEIETASGTLGGRFTTVEGIINNIADQLAESHPFLIGDSSTNTESEHKMRSLITNLRLISSGQRFGVTLVVEDPAGNSYIQDLFVPEVDPRLSVEHYERTFEENEDLGLNDMVTNDY